MINDYSLFWRTAWRHIVETVWTKLVHNIAKEWLTQTHNEQLTDYKYMQAVEKSSVKVEASLQLAQQFAKLLHYTAIKRVPHVHSRSWGFILWCLIFPTEALSIVINQMRCTVPIRYHKGFILTLQPPSKSKLVWLFTLKWMHPIPVYSNF